MQDRRFGIGRQEAGAKRLSLPARMFQLSAEFDPDRGTIGILIRGLGLARPVDGQQAAPAPKRSSAIASGNLGCCCAYVINSLIGFPLPVLRDADADQFRIGQEHVGRQAAVVAVQESRR